MLEALISHFAQLEDPRCPWRVEHKLLDILVIAVCAVLAEAESFEDIALYGRCKHGWLRGFLELPGGIPSHDTFHRVLMLIDPDRFERCFLGWVRSVFRPDIAVPRQIAIDGKTARRSFDRQRGRSPLHLVSAFATEPGLVLAQRTAGSKGGELAVLPDLLDGLDLKGCLVSLDALACRPHIAGQITARGGDYLLALKGNQKRAHAEVKRWYEAHAFARGASLRPCFDAFDDGHGRSVRRRVFACPELGPFAAARRWPGLTTVLAVETIRGINGTGKVTEDPLLSLEQHVAAGAAGRRHPKPLGDREQAALDPGRRVQRRCKPSARAQRRAQLGPAAQDRPEPGSHRHDVEGEPEGHAQVGRLG